MLKNRKGFTLVELLAVIVVLAIIIIVAMPNVIGSMNNAKEGTFKIYAKRALTDAQAKFQADELTSLGGGKSCYTISDLGLGANGKYEGYVTVTLSTTANEFKVYITDTSSFKYDGVTMQQIDASSPRPTAGKFATVTKPSGC